MGKYKDIDDFINNLAGYKSSNEWSLNIYQFEWKNEEDAKIAEVRRENLRFYLEKMKDLNPLRLFVGEAPGIKGCCRTGIPFTDERVLACERLINKKNKVDLENSFFNKLRIENNLKYSDINCKHTQKERTSYIVWERLNRLEKSDLPLLWNIYPFHPWKYEKNDVKNRKPVEKECKIGCDCLFKLLKCFKIDEIYPIGVPARDALVKVKELLNENFSNIKLKLEETEYIPHPSYKGVRKFRERLSEIYPELKDL